MSSSTSHPHLLNPTEYGWKYNGRGMYDFNWFEGEVRPKYLDALMLCTKKLMIQILMVNNIRKVPFRIFDFCYKLSVISFILIHHFIMAALPMVMLQKLGITTCNLFRI